MLAAILEASDAAPKYNPELLKGGTEEQVLLLRRPCRKQFSLCTCRCEAGIEGSSVNGLSLLCFQNGHLSCSAQAALEARVCLAMLAFWS